MNASENSDAIELRVSLGHTKKWYISFPFME